MKSPIQEDSSCGTEVRGPPASALLPWQTYTKERSLRLAFRLPFIVVPQDVQRELWHLTEHVRMVPQAGPYHTGNWTVLPLVAPDGHSTRQFVRMGDRYAATEHLNVGGALHDFLFNLTGELRRVRISGLRGGGTITWHYDDFEKKTKENVYRIHIPIATAPENFQLIGHEIHFWDHQEVWLGDYRFPHMVVNASAFNRYHLIIDLLPDLKFRSLVNSLAAFEWFGSERIALAEACQQLLRQARIAKESTHQ